MQLQDMFDKLLVERQVTVAVSKVEAENLRIQLAKKWSKYKIDMDSVGFLSQELGACSLCRRGPDETTGAYKFLLAPKLRRPTEYNVL